jgi:hypothetical protein
MSPFPHDSVVTLRADIYGVTSKQWLSSGLVVLVTRKTTLLRNMFISLLPVLFQSMAPVTESLIDALLFLIESLVAQRTLCLLRMRAGGALITLHGRVI